ncbi:hypothetical protein YC2023_020620 [Brassica napus]
MEPIYRENGCGWSINRGSWSVIHLYIQNSTLLCGVSVSNEDKYNDVSKSKTKSRSKSTLINKTYGFSACKTKQTIRHLLCSTSYNTPMMILSLAKFGDNLSPVLVSKLQNQDTKKQKLEAKDNNKHVSKEGKTLVMMLTTFSEALVRRLDYCIRFLCRILNLLQRLCLKVILHGLKIFRDQAKKNSGKQLASSIELYHFSDRVKSQNVLETFKDAFDVAIEGVFKRFKEQENWYNGDEEEDYSIKKVGNENGPRGSHFGT